MSITDELRRLHELHQSGALTDAEFAKAKASIFGPEPTPTEPADKSEAIQAGSTALKPDTTGSSNPPASPQSLTGNVGVAIGKLLRDFRALPENSRRAILWIVFGFVFAATFLFALLYFAPGPSKPVVQSMKVEDPALVERKATEQLKDLHAHIEKALFPQQPIVVELSDKRYGRHKFKVVDSNWNVEPSRESHAYPFRGTIKVKYVRWATVSHPTKEQAEADEQYFIANYDSDSWYPDAKLARDAMLIFPRYRTKVAAFVFDKAADKWIIKSEGIE